jgi:hypothetical protein
VSYKIPKEVFRGDFTKWKEGTELSRPGRFYLYGFSVEFVKIIGTTEHGSEKSLKAHWLDQMQSPV